MNISLNKARLKECREAAGISKMEAAKRMHLSQPAYLRYESGERTPSLQTLTVIANVLNTSVEYLIDQSDDPAPISFTISKADDPELFEIIRICKVSDNNMINRLITYANKLSKASSK
ncbi:helix-turn-helix domain-containing protein [Butyrivibrio sp. AC2005]|uniref:helix-turn-helix domain-containing protein n=1 Tax=Butyrivibrio sp. AC2005 TaxID=1280672 RepID=UPI0003FDD3FA|nr:helix-turn-helix transcriptional regulator [Butyrivibrio sp. AC2005]